MKLDLFAPKRIRHCFFIHLQIENHNFSILKVGISKEKKDLHKM